MNSVIEHSFKYPSLSPRLAVVAASYLCDLIFSGQLPPGSRLQPKDLKVELGISTTPIREALIQLEREGLVNLEARRGYVVSRLTAMDVRDAYMISAYIESTMATRALEYVTEEDIEGLEALDASISREVEHGDPSRIGESNRNFHDAILRLSPGGEVLRRFASSTWRFRPVQFYAYIPGWIEATRHLEIVAAFRARSATRLDEAIRSHTMLSCELLIHHLDSTNFFATS